MTIDNGEGRWNEEESEKGIDPDRIFEDFENDDAENLQAREDEATDIALAAPGGIVFDERYDDEGFNAQNNP